MTQFNKDNFEYHGGYLHYKEDNNNKLFIARFRNGGKPQFQAFLVKNFTVEEYKTMYMSGMAPLQILQTKGYISPNVRKVLKSYGLPATEEGLQALKLIQRMEAQA